MEPNTQQPIESQQVPSQPTAETPPQQLAQQPAQSFAQPQMAPPQPQPMQQSADPANSAAFQTFMPTQNKDAIICYYLGFVGIIPGIGLPFAIAALVYGRKAMKQYRLNPTPGAKGHAITGIVLAWFALAGWILFGLLLLLAAFGSSK